MVTLIQRSIDRAPNVTPRRLFGDGFKTAAFFEVVKSQGLGPGPGPLGEMARMRIGAINRCQD